VTLLAFAAERRAAMLLRRRCWWKPSTCRAQRRNCRSIFPVRTALSSKPAARRDCGRMMGQTDRQMDERTTVL